MTTIAGNRYPRELERSYDIHGFGKVLCRPIRPADEAAIVRGFGFMTEDDVRLRFFAPLRELPQRQLAQLTQIDYQREMAFVLEVLDGPQEGDIVGGARLAGEPGATRAEFAITVRSDLKRRRIGTTLMTRLLEYARERGVSEIYGDMLAENTAMIELCRRFGFDLQPLAETEEILRATRRP